MTQSHSTEFLELNPQNFVPTKRTPWAGQAISLLKNKHLSHMNLELPKLIGESWEVSTDAQFPSKIINLVDKQSNEPYHLTEILKIHGAKILGKAIFEKYGPHCPLLLKWLHANEILSLQVHPDDLNPHLKANECGKPESWLVLECDPRGYVYLGFQKGIDKDTLKKALKNGTIESCLNKISPKPMDYISVPAGCVHAVGPGVLIAEPQKVLPQKSGKTLRIWDWGRLYDEQGLQSPSGQPRDLHTEAALSTIDWSLPQGKDLEDQFVRHFKNTEIFMGDVNNPFALQVFTDIGMFRYTSLVRDAFSLFTIWSGAALLRNPNTGTQSRVVGGQSVFISAEVKQLELHLEHHAQTAPRCAIFGLWNS